jgi:hypothetical protein
MSAKSSFPIAEQLNNAQVAISNSLAQAEIQALVAGYGYPLTKLNEGKTLLEAAQAAVLTQKAAEGDQQQATEELLEAEKTAHDAYQALAQVARAIFQEDKARLTALGLTGAMPFSTAGFLAAAAVLFDNASTAPALTGYGYTPEKLAAERAKITAYDQANQRQEAAKGAAQQSTREQAAALAELNTWMAQYLKIARVALREKRQLLEKLGVPARTTPRTRNTQEKLTAD